MKLPKQLKKLIKKLEKQPDYVRLGLMLVVAYGIYYLFKQLRWGVGNNFYLEGFGNKDFKDKTFVFFKMNGCGHCKAMQSEWDKFVKHNDPASSGVKTAIVVAQEDKETTEKYKITGFPTLLLIEKNEIVKSFDEPDRTADKFKSFITSN
tara:strand:+ start:454 stop:903 length:450 start_codon:yes stop_codon:yes gene_type:complete